MNEKLMSGYAAYSTADTYGPFVVCEAPGHHRHSADHSLRLLIWCDS